MPRIYGQAMSGGPLEARHVPLPLGVVVHTPPKVVRAWATSHGMHVATVGALPKNVLHAYQEAIQS